MIEYKAIFDVDCGRMDKKKVISHQYGRNDSFKANNDAEAYDLAIITAKEMAKKLYANPDNGCTTIKLNALYNGKRISFNVLEGIIQYSHKDDKFLYTSDKGFQEVIFKGYSNLK
ncbi:MAG TPA: hypothetical protein VEC16_04590 [Alphaproteobacteria bacterium]|nr:hypothetical protein [Alphaproteobacteria bacterium]